MANNKTLLTGWGEAGVPRYHPQYISISGIVHFKSTDARKLPITTTKRGIDASSELYLHVKERMREGLKVFTAYTSKWKQLPKEEKQRSKKARAATPSAMFERVKKIDPPQAAAGKTSSKKSQSIWNPIKTQKLEIEKRFIPNLPSPPPMAQRQRIVFHKPVEEVQIVAEFLFDDADCPAATVGEACFAEILREAQGEES